MCYCLCAVNHRTERGICTGTVETSLAFQGVQDGEVKEMTIVGMCRACKKATIGATGGAAKARYV